MYKVVTDCNEGQTGLALDGGLGYYRIFRLGRSLGLYNGLFGLVDRLFGFIRRLFGFIRRLFGFLRLVGNFGSVRLNRCVDLSLGLVNVSLS